MADAPFSYWDMMSGRGTREQNQQFANENGWKSGRQIGTAIFGGDNQSGFFGGGRRVLDPKSYDMDQAGEMNFRYDAGANQAQERMYAGDNPYAMQQQARGQQQQLVGNLFGALTGNQPSVAQQQLQNTTQSNVANAYAMAAANPNNAGAARMAVNNAGAINQQAAGQGAMLRAQEMQNAQGMLGNVLGGMRGQDTGAYQALQQGLLGNLGGQQQLQATRMQAQIAREQQAAQNFSGAQQNAIGGKIFNAAAGVGAAFAGKAHGGYIEGGGSPGVVMGDRVCSGCGKMNSDCECWKKAMGGLIPGGQGKTGDSLKSDTVPTMLSPGEIVLPRSVAQSEDAPAKAKLFVEAIRAQRMKRAA